MNILSDHGTGIKITSREKGPDERNMGHEPIIGEIYF